ncbi:MAG: HAD-IB family hydrolase [Sulfurospirillaceae bacterium]|nr:HAD-IB family hydrolase [Sulfurospirillaceae bacterium]
MTIAFFDFDGTLTTKDSLFEFIKFSVGRIAFFKGMIILLPVLVGYKIGLIKSADAKLAVLNHFFAHNENLWKKKTQLFSEVLPCILNPNGYKKLKWHQQKGHPVVIVTASMESWLSGWCIKENVTLIATKVIFIQNKLTYLSQNCQGAEKVKRIAEKYNLDEYKTIYAYGDTSADIPMLSLATHAYYKKFS